jgi:hypothetical protein
LRNRWSRLNGYIQCNWQLAGAEIDFTLFIASSILLTILLYPATIITDLGPNAIAAILLLLPSTLYSSIDFRYPSYKGT